MQCIAYIVYMQCIAYIVPTYCLDGAAVAKNSIVTPF